MIPTKTKKAYPKSSRISLQYLRLLDRWNRDQFAWRFELVDLAEAAFRKHRAPRSAQDLYMVLLRSRLRIGGRIMPRRAVLGTAIGRCDKTVQRSIRWLEDRGIVTVSRDGSGEIQRINVPFRRLRQLLQVPAAPKAPRRPRATVAACGKESTLSTTDSPRGTFLSPSHPLESIPEGDRLAATERKTDLCITLPPGLPIETSRHPLLARAEPPGQRYTATAPRPTTLPGLAGDLLELPSRILDPPG